MRSSYLTIDVQTTTTTMSYYCITINFYKNNTIVWTHKLYSENFQSVYLKQHFIDYDYIEVLGEPEFEESDDDEFEVMFED